jgi:formylglycine-generating enzyme required for sulfatase activity
MSRYPVTQRQWQAMMGKNPSYFKGDNRPVEEVSWYEVAAFCQRLSEKTAKSIACLVKLNGSMPVERVLQLPSILEKP